MRDLLGGAAGEGSTAAEMFKLSQDVPPLSSECCSSVRNTGKLGTKCPCPLCCDELPADLLPNFVLQLLSLSQ